MAFPTVNLREKQSTSRAIRISILLVFFGNLFGLRPLLLWEAWQGTHPHRRHSSNNATRQLAEEGGPLLSAFILVFACCFDQHTGYWPRSFLPISNFETKNDNGLDEKGRNRNMLAHSRGIALPKSDSTGLSRSLQSWASIYLAPVLFYRTEN